MQVVIVGPRAARDRLRRALADTGVEVAAEAESLAAARALDVRADGFLLASGHRRTVPDAPDRVQPLTPRELDVLALLGQGRSNKAIATALGISDQTVKFHVASICGKLEAHNRTEAVRIAIDGGWIAV
jgi:DNA-binding NarL/FixJ family response regulator